MCNTAFRIAVAGLALAAGSASAQIFNQIGQVYQLPTEDFTYNWGDLRDKGEFSDLKTSGVEEDFRCVLEMELRPGSRFGDIEMREYEKQLASRLDFIYQSVILMNQFDLARELKWATLTCKKGAPELDQSDAARAEREAKARERALRAQQRRRERNRD